MNHILQRLHFIFGKEGVGHLNHWNKNKGVTLDNESTNLEPLIYGHI